MLKDQKTLAFINMFAVLGTLEELCREAHEETARILTNKKPVSLALAVKDGPSATFTFENGYCRVKPGVHPCNVKLPFSSCEKFNGLIDGTVTPIPSKGFTHIGFLTKDFTKLTDLLSFYLQKAPEDNEISTKLLFYTISSAISQIGNYDEIGSFSASNIVDGTVMLSIKGGPKSAILCKDHKLATVKEEPESPRAVMEFESLTLARKLFDGKINSFACIGNGSISIRGMISMVDNINRILDRVAVYLG